MKETLKLHRPFLLLYLTFFLFFFLVTPIMSSAQLYFEQIDQPRLFEWFLIVSAVSMIVMPLVIPFLTSKIHGYLLIIASILLAAFLLLAGNLLLGNQIAFIFFIPFLTRVFNNVLVPWIAKSTSDANRASVFAIRDVFLYLGVSGGFLLLALSSSMEIFSPGFVLTALLIFTAMVCLFLVINKRNSNRPAIKSAGPEKETEEPFQFLNYWRKVTSKNYLLVICVVTLFTTWIVVCASFLPGFIKTKGFDVTSIFEAYSIAYIFVPIFGFLATLIKTRHNKNWYLFDLLFDILPLTILAIAPSKPLLIIGVIVYQMKDFVSPLSLSYFFDIFHEKEYDYVWGLNASITSAFSLGMPLIIGLIYQINPILIILTSILSAIISGLIAFFFLPNRRKESIPTPPGG